MLSIDDIEHVHFERVMFNAKSFDLVAIFKPNAAEKLKLEFIRISSIPMKDLDMIKGYLDDVAELVSGYSDDDD